jgi:hypothetical protein
VPDRINQLGQYLANDMITDPTGYFCLQVTARGAIMTKLQSPNVNHLYIPP